MEELEYTLKFGKYKNLTIEDILGIDPEYLSWLNENIRSFKNQTLRILRSLQEKGLIK